MRLGASREALRPELLLDWAEVVPVSLQGGAATDFHERSKGRMALRLLGVADFPTLARVASVQRRHRFGILLVF